MQAVQSWLAQRTLQDALTVLAVILSAAGLYFARKSAGAADRSATEAARSAAAAERQAEATERQADAAERSLTAPVSEPLAPVAWNLTRVAGADAAYRLRNLGTEDAHNVRLLGLPPEAKDLVRFSDGVTIKAGHAADLMIFKIMGSTVTSVEVRWDPGGCETLSV